MAIEADNECLTDKFNLDSSLVARPSGTLHVSTLSGGMTSSFSALFVRLQDSDSAVMLRDIRRSTQTFALRPAPYFETPSISCLGVCTLGAHATWDHVCHLQGRRDR